jgi:hypothetical protein
MSNHQRRLAAAIAGVLLFLAFGAASCRQEPKGRDVSAVRKACGPEVAARYASIDWVDREYASDNLLITCILFPGEVRTKDNVGKDQTGG